MDLEEKSVIHDVCERHIMRGDSFQQPIRHQRDREMKMTMREWRWNAECMTCGVMLAYRDLYIDGKIPDSLFNVLATMMLYMP